MRSESTRKVASKRRRISYLLPRGASGTDIGMLKGAMSRQSMS